MAEAVESVLAQDFKDWELILVDDGSTDASPAMAADFARRHSNVRVVSHPKRENRGLAASRIRGSDHATGEYLMFLDHDDVLFPDALSSMVRVLDENRQAAAVFALTVFWAFDPSVADRDTVQSHYPLRPGTIGGGKMLRDLIRSDHHHPANCSTLYRRAALLSVRDTTAAYDGMYEDTALLFKLLCRYDVYLLEKPVSSYRLHARSMSHQAQAQGTFNPVDYNADRHRFLRWVAQSGLPLHLPSRAALRWTLAKYRVEQWMAKFNVPRAQAILAYVFARV
jgi:glycosyltransferase involved in cell wall biosynthesis